MLPFPIRLTSGRPIYEQVVFAAKKAIVMGILREGDKFPSVRELSEAIKINPNTAQKIIRELEHERFIEIRPGLGSVVAHRPSLAAQDAIEAMQAPLDELIIQAKQYGLSLDAFVKEIRKQWEFRSGGKR